MNALQTALPIPSDEAMAHSAQLVEYLKHNIRCKGGWLSFADFMDGLLYAPGLGYYAAGATKFGRAGDFVTAPEISPTFGRTIARYIAPILGHIQDPVILEPGAGTGRLAVSMLIGLQQLNALPQRYCILEPSPSLQQIQREHLAEYIPELIDRVEWLDSMPDKIRGIVIANEVLDAMPVHLMVATEQSGVFLERGVALSENEQNIGQESPSSFQYHSPFIWKDRPASPQLNESAACHLSLDIRQALEPGAVFELGLPAEAWCRFIADRFDQGQIILIDYGFPAREMYHPQRRNGTLMCHYRHHAHNDPFWYPGLQDVTAHIDFTSIARTFLQSGLNIDQYQTQAGFLLGSGILETLTPGLEPGSVAWLRETTAIQKLLSPAEMGELFKVMIASRAIHSDHRQDEILAQQVQIAEQLGV
jgi:SAM-dependent MidA family methyltransferase